jgi:hypothetical protein
MLKKREVEQRLATLTSHGLWVVLNIYDAVKAVRAVRAVEAMELCVCNHF